MDVEIAMDASAAVGRMAVAAFGDVQRMEDRERELVEVQHETKLGSGSQTRGR